MSSCEDIFGRKLACLRRQTGGPLLRLPYLLPCPFRSGGGTKGGGHPRRIQVNQQYHFIAGRRLVTKIETFFSISMR